MSARPTFVLVDGPYPTTNRDGDEVPYWTVSLCNEDDDHIKCYELRSFDRAYNLARNISRDRGIELVNEGSNA